MMSPFGPICFNISGAMFSGPAALDGLMALKALLTSSAVESELIRFGES